MSDYKISIHKRALQIRNLHVCSDRTRFSVSWKSLGDSVSRHEKGLFNGLSGKRLYSLRLQVQEASLPSI